MVPWSCLGFIAELVPTSTSLAWSLTASSHSKTMCGIVSRASQRIGILRLVKRIFGDTSVLLSLLFWICSPNPWALFSGMGVSFWMSPSASWTPGVFGCQALYDLCFLLCHQHRVADFSTLYKVNSNSNHCLFSDLRSASTRVRHTELRPQLINWSLKYQGVERPNLLDISCQFRFECEMAFPALCLTTEHWVGSRVQSTIGWCVSFSFPWHRCLWGCESNL